MHKESPQGMCMSGFLAYVQQCSAALRRCHSIQAKINDLRINPDSPGISPKKAGIPEALTGQLPPVLSYEHCS